jgi:hypothetical protein
MTPVRIVPVDAFTNVPFARKSSYGLRATRAAFPKHGYETSRERKLTFQEAIGMAPGFYVLEIERRHQEGNESCIWGLRGEMIRRRQTTLCHLGRCGARFGDRICFFAVSWFVSNRRRIAGNLGCTRAKTVLHVFGVVSLFEAAKHRKRTSEDQTMG